MPVVPERHVLPGGERPDAALPSGLPVSEQRGTDLVDEKSHAMLVGGEEAQRGVRWTACGGLLNARTLPTTPIVVSYERLSSPELVTCNRGRR